MEIEFGDDRIDTGSLRRTFVELVDRTIDLNDDGDGSFCFDVVVMHLSLHGVDFCGLNVYRLFECCELEIFGFELFGQFGWFVNDVLL